MQFISLKHRIQWLCIGLLLSATTMAATQPPIVTPVGYWKSYYYHGSRPQGIVKITKHKNKKGIMEYDGIIYVGWPNRFMENNHLICLNCPKPYTDRFLACLPVMWGYRHAPNTLRTWYGGHILDIFRKKIYGSKFELSADGNTMTILGYVGFYFIGKTQTWHRINASQAQHDRRQAIAAWKDSLLHNEDHYRAEVQYLQELWKGDTPITEQDVLRKLECHS